MRAETHCVLMVLICLTLSIPARANDEAISPPFGMTFGEEFHVFQAHRAIETRDGYKSFEVNPVVAHRALSDYLVTLTPKSGIVFRVTGRGYYRDRTMLQRVYDAYVEELDHDYGPRSDESAPGHAIYVRSPFFISLHLDEREGRLSLMCTHAALGTVALREKWEAAAAGSAE